MPCAMSEPPAPADPPVVASVGCFAICFLLRFAAQLNADVAPICRASCPVGGSSSALGGRDHALESFDHVDRASESVERGRTIDPIAVAHAPISDFDFCRHATRFGCSSFLVACSSQ